MTMALASLKLLLIVIELTGITAWHLEARPPFKYTSSGGSPTITCYNISSTTRLSRNSRWYKVSPNGTLQQLPTDTNERVRSDRSQLRISSARSEDNGKYCCKGLMQTLDACDARATTTLIITMPPMIVPGENQTVFVTNNVTLECVITDVGNPSFVVFRWQKSGQRLVTDGTKYISQLIGNRMFLTIINSTTNDGGHYQCILETPVYQRRQAFVYLIVNHTGTTHVHTGLANVTLPNTNYSLQIYGEDELSVGMNLTIKCTVMRSSSSVETSDIQLCLVLPTGEIIKGREFSTVATLKHNGTYSCIALLNGSSIIVSLPVIVYAAPQPTFHSHILSLCYGSNVTLPCAIDVANPSPSYYWEHLPLGYSSTTQDLSEVLSDGSLQLVNVQNSGVYRCTAENDYGSSVQLIELNIEIITIRKPLIGTHLQLPCDQPEHPLQLSTLLQQYITSICSCGHITVNVTVTSCIDQTAMYSVQFTGVMATEAASLLVTNIEGLTDGLDLGITVLFLPGQGYSTSCDNQNRTVQSESLAIISTLSVIITILLILFLISALIYLRKRLTTNGQKHTANDKPYYNSANPWHPIHRQLQYSTKATTFPLRRFNSDNFLTDHTKVCLQYQDSRGDNNNTAPYLPNDQPDKAVTVLSNPTTGGIAINKTNAKSMQVIESKGSNDDDDDDNDDMDFIPSTTHPSYVYIKKSKI